MTALGTVCHAIQPSLKDIDGNMRFTFDNQFMIDLDVEMTLQAQKADTTSNSYSVIVFDKPGSSSQASTPQSSSSSSCRLNLHWPKLLIKERRKQPLEVENS